MSVERKTSRLTRKVRAPQSSMMYGLRRSVTFTRGSVVVVCAIPVKPSVHAVSPYDTTARIAGSPRALAPRLERQVGPHRDSDETREVRQRDHDAALLASGAHTERKPITPRRQAHDVAALARERLVIHFDGRCPGEDVEVAVARHRQQVARLAHIETLREHEH